MEESIYTCNHHKHVHRIEYYQIVLSHLSSNSGYLLQSLMDGLTVCSFLYTITLILSNEKLKIKKYTLVKKYTYSCYSEIHYIL